MHLRGGIGLLGILSPIAGFKVGKLCSRTVVDYPISTLSVRHLFHCS